MKGRHELQDYRDEHKLTYRLLFQFFLARELRLNKDSVITYLRRYKDESGFA